MSGLNDLWHRLTDRFGRPDDPVMPPQQDAVSETGDTRLTELTREQLEIRARLRILEKAGNPRGIGLDF